MAEVYYSSAEEAMPYYGTAEEPLADFPFNFNFIFNFQNRSDVSGYSIKASVDSWLNNMPEGKWPNWVVSVLLVGLCK